MGRHRCSRWRPRSAAGKVVAHGRIRVPVVALDATVNVEAAPPSAANSADTPTSAPDADETPDGVPDDNADGGDEAGLP
jgi:hypothetical protein